MTTRKKIIVPPEATSERLDVFLSATLGVSRSQVQKLIATGEIKINNKIPKKAGDRIKTDDEITIVGKSATTSTSNSTTSAAKPKSPGLKDFNIPMVKETPAYVVLDKPSGLLVHPTMAKETASLAAWLLKKYPAIKKVGDDPIRPGIVHRLDKEASGLLVVARTQPMFNHLKDQFKNRTIGKEYLALVHGRVAKDWDEINFPIARSETTDRMAALPRTSRGTATIAGKEAKTEFLVEQRFVNFTLLRVIIHTGRMHQIRAHFLAYNHPLVGDPLYIQKKRKRAWDKKLGRLFLHSTKLSFTDLADKRKTFTSPLPKELGDFLKTLA